MYVSFLLSLSINHDFTIDEFIMSPTEEGDWSESLYLAGWGVDMTYSFTLDMIVSSYIAYTLLTRRNATTSMSWPAIVLETALPMGLIKIFAFESLGPFSAIPAGIMMNLGVSSSYTCC